MLFDFDLDLFAFIAERSTRAVTVPKLYAVPAADVDDNLPTGEPPLRHSRCTISYEDCTTILAKMFMGKLDMSDVVAAGKEDTFQGVSMIGLLRSPLEHERQKLACILSYFRTVRDAPELSAHGGIVIERNSVVGAPQPFEETLALGCTVPVAFTFHGRGIEDITGGDVAHVDFANRFIGGGVLCGGAVQEEIMFAQRPELIVTLAVCERMLPHEAIVVANARTFARTSGYYRSFNFESACCDASPPIIAIDAPDCRKVPWSLKHTLTKAVAGFSAPLLEEMNVAVISTGNWGCGVFANEHSKMIACQMIAVSITERWRERARGARTSAPMRIAYAHFGSEKAISFAETLRHNKNPMDIIVDIIAK